MSGPSFGIYNMVVPSSGPKVVDSGFDFGTQTADIIDLSAMTQGGTLDFIQGGYFDNLDGQHGVFVTVGNAGGGQRVYVPPRSALYTPLLVSNPPVIRGRVAAPGAKVPVFLYNVPVPPLLVKNEEPA